MAGHPSQRATSVLLAAHPTVGHTQALRAIGLELLARGHEVGFAISRVPRVPAVIAAQPLRAAQDVLRGLTEDRLSPISTPFSLRATWAASRVASTRGYDELRWATELFTCDALATARALAATLVARRVGLVVHDFTFFGAWLAAEVAGVPSVAVFHSGLPFPAPGQAPFGSGLTSTDSVHALEAAQRALDAISARIDHRLADARAALRLPPLARGLLTRPYSTSLNVLTSFEAFELPRPELAREAAGPVLWAGPCLGARSEAGGPAGVLAPAGTARERAARTEGPGAGEPLGGADFPWDRLRGDSPLVYVSLGTVFNDQPEVYRALLEGVHRAGARAVVAAGASVDRVRRVASSTDVIVRFAPQVALLPRVDLVIGHGGNNSTNETLRAGKPLLVLPFGAEQIANAQRVEALGVGHMLRAEDLSSLPGIIERALGAPMRERARRLAESVPARDGAPIVADALEALARG